MKLTSIVAASCLLTALAPAAMAQDLFTFNTGTPSGQAATVPGQNGFLYNGQVITSDNNPLQTATADIINVGGDANFVANGAYQFLDNGPANNPNFGTNLDGIVLANADGLPDTELKLHFAQPITSISLDFAILNLTQNNVPVDTLGLSMGLDSSTSQGTFNATSYDFEGDLSVTSTSGPMTQAVISIKQTDGATYYLDNIRVTEASAVPEPGIVTLILAGIIPTVGLLRRRRTR